MEKKIKSVQKNIFKALNQLKGAIRKIRAGNKITTKDGIEIEFDRNIVPHGVVLISELVPFGNWDKVVFETIKLIKDSKSMIHILDLRELTVLVSFSRDENVFDYNLMERWNGFIQVRDVFIRMRPESNKE